MTSSNNTTYKITIPNEGTWEINSETKEEFEELAKIGKLKYFEEKQK